MVCATRRLAPLLAVTTIWCDAVLAEDERFHVAARGSITVADGEPANDIPGYGVFARMQVAPGWRVGLALDATEYDFEQPAKVIGIVQDPSLEPIDALAEANTLGAGLERSIERGRVDWFFGAGVGAASVDVPDVAGARGDGGSFDIHTEVDTEIIVSAIAGVRGRLGSRAFVEFALRADQHFASWRITDRISGAQGTIGDYFAYGGFIAVGVRW